MDQDQIQENVYKDLDELHVIMDKFFNRKYKARNGAFDVNGK